MFALATLSLLALVAAQNASITDVEYIEANFEAAQLVPELLSTFTPQGTLSVSFGGSAITIGQNISQTDVASYPSLTIMPASNATGFDSSSNYTVMLVDADVVGTDESATQQTRHWLVNGATLSGDPPYAVGYNGAISVTDYTGPGPAAGSGSHRYVLLVFSQPSTFTAPDGLNTAGTPLGTFSLSNYVSTSGLGPVVAANYFQVENGVATATPSATTSVDSATLAAGATTMASGTAGSASTSGSATGATTSKAGSAAASGTSAAASASTSKAAAAGRNGSRGWGLVLGGLGVVGTVLCAGLGL